MLTGDIINPIIRLIRSISYIDDLSKVNSKTDGSSHELISMVFERMISRLQHATVCSFSTGTVYLPSSPLFLVQLS